MYKYDPDGERFIQDVAVGSNPTAITKCPVDANNPTGYSQVPEEQNAGGVVARTYTLGHDVARQAPGSQGGEPLVRFRVPVPSVERVRDSIRIHVTSPFAAALTQEEIKTSLGVSAVFGAGIIVSAILLRASLRVPV